MADKSKIEWTDATWNPVTGCAKVSTGCKNCYAERDWARLQHLPAYACRAFTDVRCHPKRLNQPLRWNRPRRVFVNSMSDLFHPDVPDAFIDQVFAVMTLCHQHTFQVLTKRPERMRDYMLGLVPDRAGSRWYESIKGLFRYKGSTGQLGPEDHIPPRIGPVLPNVWLGVSVENQSAADERIPLLLQTPAAVRWVSAEPLLGRVDLCEHLGMWFNQTMGCWEGTGSRINVAPDGRPRIGWVVVGGESGPKSRPMHPDWARSLRDQCAAAGVPFLFKQWGEWEIASQENGHTGSVMPESGDKYTWVGVNGETYNPSAPTGQDCYAMARVGKKAAGRLLDGVLHDGYPS